MATLRVIDAASHQGNMNQKAMDFDALIVKATEGVSYVNPYCDGEFQEALSLGKKLGVYHFARNTKNSADAEANFFINNTKGYIGKAIPVLDWEDSNTSDVAWALRWLQLVEKAYGCKPMIYMSESVVNAHDWSAVANGNYGLWCAKYRDNIPDYNWDMASAGSKPSVKYWKVMALWQWTSVGRLNGHSGNLDCSIFYGDGAAWDKYVGKTSSARYVLHSFAKNRKIYDNQTKTYIKDAWCEIDGKWYYAGKDELLLTEWQSNLGSRWKCYFIAPDWHLHSGWLSFGDTVYYCIPKDGSLARGKYKVDDKWYYFDDNGIRKKGCWITDGNKKYYAMGDASLRVGWLSFGKTVYYCNENAEIVTGIVTIGSDKYFFNDEGVRQTRWQEVDGKKYWFDATTGKMLKGLITFGDTWYYLSTVDGHLMRTDDNGKLY